MSIVVKNSQLSDDTITALNDLIDMDISAGTAFRLTRIIKELSSIIEDKIKMEKRILDKWTVKDESGNPVPAVDDDGNVVENAVRLSDPDKFSEEISNLMETENEIPYDRINFEELQLKTAKVKDLMKIEFLFS